MSLIKKSIFDINIFPNSNFNHSCRRVRVSTYSYRNGADSWTGIVLEIWMANKMSIRIWKIAAGEAERQRGRDRKGHC